MNSQRARPELWTVASQRTYTRFFFFRRTQLHKIWKAKLRARDMMEAADLVVKRDAVTVRTSSDIAINGNLMDRMDKPTISPLNKTDSFW